MRNRKPPAGGTVCIRCLTWYGSRQPGERCGDMSCRTMLPPEYAECDGLLVPDSDLRLVLGAAGIDTAHLEQLCQRVRLLRGLAP